VNEKQKQRRSPVELGFRLVGIIVILASFAGAWLLMDFQAFREQALQIPDEGTQLVVKPGSSLRAIAGELQQRQLLDPGSRRVNTICRPA
jgi:cell division protein YceG involved in septum cleavage